MAGQGLGAGVSVAAGAVVVAVAGFALWSFGLAPSPEVAPEAGEVAQPAAALVAPVAAPEASPDLAVAPPTFDVVRVDAEGNATVAGLAVGGAEVSLRVDGQEIARAPVDGAGNFVALFTLPPSEVPRLLSLALLLPEGSEVASLQSVALGPTPKESAEPAAVATALLVTESGATVLQAAPEPAPETAVAEDQPAQDPPLVQEVTIAAISYSAEGAVQLSGMATAGQFLRAYLDSAEVGTVQVPPSGLWSLTLADVKPAVYTLRVDQLDAAGMVTSRVETPFQREAPEVVVAALAPEPEPEPEPAPKAEPDPVAAPAEDPAKPAAEPEPEPAPVPEAEVAPASAPAEPAKAADPAPPKPVSITVQPGSTLWRIATENFGEGVMYVQVFEANRALIRDPDLIYPGQVFTIPAQN